MRLLGFSVNKERSYLYQGKKGELFAWGAKLSIYTHVFCPPPVYRHAALGPRAPRPEAFGLDLGDQVSLQDGAPLKVALLQGPAGFLDQLAQQLLEVRGPRSEVRLSGQHTCLFNARLRKNRCTHFPPTPFVALVAFVPPVVAFW